MDFHLGQRLSLKSDLCTVRYIGQVDGKSRVWLGVEWDDAQRGKHNGTFDGKQYFTCKSPSSKAASFLRPDSAWDKPRTFLEALRHKYFQTQDAVTDEIIYVSRSKHFEEVGFDKFAKRQAELRGIHTIVLNGMQISQCGDAAQVMSTCAEITDLDISWNVFESWDDILSLCRLLPKLRDLTVDGNRFTVDLGPASLQIPNVRSLSMASTLVTAEELQHCMAAFPALQNVSLPANGMSQWKLELAAQLPVTLTTVDLSANDIDFMEDISAILSLPALQSLKLHANNITAFARQKSTTSGCSTLQSLDISDNQIASWHELDAIVERLPALQQLQTDRIPLHSSSDAVGGQLIAPAAVRTLMIARYPQITLLDRVKITNEMKLNAEKYYLTQVAEQLAKTPETDEDAVLANHPRWHALCDEYGTPVIVRKLTEDIDPSSLAARLVKVNARVALASTAIRVWEQEVPKSLSVYALYGMIGEWLDKMPLDLRIVWETGEKDPVGSAQQQVEYWDSSDDDGDTDDWVLREVELVPGTRSLATYFEGREVTVRVETRQ